VVAVWPLVIAVPMGLLAAWIGLAFLLRAWRLRRAHAARDGPEEPTEHASTPPPSS
jgi:hypothetical protein